MTEIDTDKLRALHTAANRIADNGNHLAIKVSSGCFDYCSGGCDCAEEAKRIKATADSDAVEFHRLISAILAMAEENKRLREALERIERIASGYEPDGSDYDEGFFEGQRNMANIARRALGKDKA